MADKDRRYTSIIFMSALVMTVFSAVALESRLLVFLCLLVQIPAYIWYVASYIPFARSCILNCIKSVFRRWYLSLYISATIIYQLQVSPQNQENPRRIRHQPSWSFAYTHIFEISNHTDNEYLSVQVNQPQLINHKFTPISGNLFCNSLIQWREMIHLWNLCSFTQSPTE
jgi:hypothetical protein